MSVNNLFDKLSIITESLNFFIPEALITAAILLVLLIDLIGRSRAKGLVTVVAFLSMGLVISSDISQVLNLTEKPLMVFLRMIQLDQVSALWKVVLDAGLIFTLAINLRSREKAYRSEYTALLLFILLGAHLLVMSANLLMIYLSIEIMSIGAYVLTAYSFEKRNFEAAIKYLLFGGVASAVMIYGLSLIYTFTGSLEFTSPQFIDALMEVDSFALTVAGVMVLAGMLFKISAVPMHIWAPDVYEAAPTSSVAFFSIVPKLAGLAILVKWILVINLFGLGGVPWPKILGAIALLTLTVGNFSALWQSNVKRLLAYSSIAHSGFLLLAIVAFSETGLQSLLFYAMIYVLMNMAAFLLINYYENRYGARSIDDYKGISKKSPMLTILMVVVMIALTGLPPTAGFTAKLFVFSALWESYSNTGQTWLVIVFAFGLLNAVVSLFYYLKIPYFMIFKESKESDKIQEVPVLENFLGIIMVLGLLVFFFKPDWLMIIINNLNFAF